MSVSPIQEHDKKVARVEEKRHVKHQQQMKELHRSLGKAAKAREMRQTRGPKRARSRDD